MSRSVFVTGGSSGLGLEIARVHARRGDRVAILARGRDRLDAAATALRAEGATIDVHAVDVRDASAVGEALREFAAKRGPVDRLYANAGRSDAPERDGAFDRETFETNVYGVVNAAEAWLGTAPPRGAGAGIIASFSAFRGLPGIPAYGASKAAVTVYAESLRGRLRPAGLGVTTVFLGYLDSELATGARPSILVTPCAKAAAVVVRAVDRGATSVAYPALVRALVLATRALPDAVYDRLVARRYREDRR